MGIIIRKTIVLITTLIFGIFTYNTIQNNVLNRDDKFIVIPEYRDVFYEELTSNTYIVQREAINNIAYNLQQDGYTESKAEITPSYVDLIYKKNSEIWRYNLDLETNYLVFFKNQYEDSYIGSTYIIEKGYK